MVPKKNRALLLTAAVILTGVSLWFLYYPTTGIKHNANPLLVYGSQLFAIMGFTLYALSFFFSIRSRRMEKYFGGLDELYHWHHSIGKAAFFSILLHPVLLALRWFPENTEKVLWYLFPFHNRAEINLGSWALMGLSLLVIFTVGIKLPYDKWKISHKFMGIFFVLGILHIFYLQNFITEKPLLAIYFLLISVLGTGAFLYQSIFYGWLREKHRCQVTKVERLTSQVMEISLRSEDGNLDFIPGQFCFFEFEGASISKESHPFTICSTSTENGIRILVKNLGDYTSKLYAKLQPGTTGLLDGPYGCFNYREGRRKQLWIAGGVGIAPFISWARNLSTRNSFNYQIDLYYCFKTKADSTHIKEFEDLQSRFSGFHLHKACSAESGHLNASDIKNIEGSSIFICGPKKLRKVLLREFKRRNIPDSDIFYEDFDFS